MKKKEVKSGMPAKVAKKGTDKKWVNKKMGKGPAPYKAYGENPPPVMEVHEPQTPYIRVVKTSGDGEPWRPPFGYGSFDMPGYNLCRLILDQGHTHAYIWILRRAKTMDDVLYTAVIPMMVIDGTVTPDYITSGTFHNLLAPFVGRDVPGFHNRNTRETRFKNFRTLWELFASNKKGQPLATHFKELVEAFHRLSDRINAKPGLGKAEAACPVARNYPDDASLVNDDARPVSNGVSPTLNGVPPASNSVSQVSNSVSPASGNTRPVESGGYYVGTLTFNLPPLGRDITVELSLHPNPLFPDEWVSVSRMVE